MWFLLILLFLSEVHALSIHRKRDVSETYSSSTSLVHLISINREDDPAAESSQSSHGQFSFSDFDPRRRHLLLQSPLVSILLQCFPLMPASAEAVDQNHKSNAPRIDRGIFDDRTFLESLIYDKVLGKGSFKTVYKVHSNSTALALSNLVDDVDNSKGKNTSSSSSMPMSLQFAMSVEPLRTKSQTKEALRATEIVQFLQEKTKKADNQVDNNNFEQLYTWWIQMNLPEFSPGRRIFSQTDLDQAKTRRTQKRPSNYLGTLWLVSFKPLYDMDLKTFMHNTPTMIPLGSKERKTQQSFAARHNNNSTDALPMPLTEQSAIKFAFELCRAGDILHSAGLVHRDIKPKNIMIWKEGRPVIIDFGFAQFGDSVSTAFTTRKRKTNGYEDFQKRICVTEPGKVKGEVGYVLAKDVPSYRGCQEGDLYAMGKTLFELYFEPNFSSSVSSSSSSSLSSSSSSSSQIDMASTKHTINETAARKRNDEFRAKLNDPHVGTSSRFELSEHGRNVLMKVIRGLCTEDQPLTFADAARILHDFRSRYSEQERSQ